MQSKPIVSLIAILLPTLLCLMGYKIITTKDALWTHVTWLN